MTDEAKVEFSGTLRQVALMKKSRFMETQTVAIRKEADAGVPESGFAPLT